MLNQQTHQLQQPQCGQSWVSGNQPAPAPAQRPSEFVTVNSALVCRINGELARLRQRLFGDPLPPNEGASNENGPADIQSIVSSTHAGLLVAIEQLEAIHQRL
jgi:hypothetical protein